MLSCRRQFSSWCVSVRRNLSLAWITTTVVVAAFCQNAVGQAKGSPTPEIPATVFNFRDVGGVSIPGGRCVRPRLVFRSGKFDTTTNEDSATVARKFGLTTYFDLRSPAEWLGGVGPAGLTKAGVKWHPVSIDCHEDPLLQLKRPTPSDWGAFYARSFERRGDVFAELLTQIAHAQGPVVYGCTLGKDRTGIATALLLAVLGVSDEAITRDYLLTNAPLLAHPEKMQAVCDWMGLTREDYIVGFATVYPEVLATFLRHVRNTYGSVDQAMLAKGMTPEALRLLRTRLLASGADCR